MNVTLTKQFVLKFIDMLKRNNITDSKNYNEEQFYQQLVKKHMPNQEKMLRNVTIFDSGLIDPWHEFRLQKVKNVISTLTKFANELPTGGKSITVPNPPKLPELDEDDVEIQDTDMTEEIDEEPISEFHRAIKRATHLF